MLKTYYYFVATVQKHIKQVRSYRKNSEKRTAGRLRYLQSFSASYIHQRVGRGPLHKRPGRIIGHGVSFGR
jgi:hypothetical protein